MSKQPLYGYPCVEDPHDFDPDVECCSPAEIETWRRACANFGKPSYEPNKGCFTYCDDGRVIVHVARTSWGIGTNLIDSCDGCSEPTDAPLMTCHECGGPEFCPTCWAEHERKHEDGAL